MSDPSLIIRIAQILRQHRGRENCITSVTIARRLGYSPGFAREIRRTIAGAQNDGTWEELELPVLAIPGGGYFVGRGIEEFLCYHRTLSALKAEAARKVPAFEKLAKSCGFNLRALQWP